MAKEIMVRHGAVTRIAKSLGVSRTTVWMALGGADRTDVQRMIRRKAIDEHGGRYCTSVHQRQGSEV